MAASLFFKLADVFQRALRRRIAPVGEGMHPNLYARGGDELGKRRHVVLVRVHAAIGKQPQQMAGAAGLFQGFDQ